MPALLEKCEAAVHKLSSSHQLKGESNVHIPIWWTLGYGIRVLPTYKV